MAGLELKEAKAHYDFELARKAEINTQLRNNIQLAIAGLGFHFLVGTGDSIPLNNSFPYFFWASALLISFALALSTLASLLFSTRYPDSPDVIRSYYEKLKKHDAKTAESKFGEFIIDRWIDNASTNSRRNRERSRHNYYSRVLLALSTIPFAVVLLMSVKVRFPI